MSGGRIPLRVYIILGFGILSFASSSILVRLAGQEGAPGLATASLRTAITTLILIPFVAHRALPELRKLSARHHLLTIGAGVLLSLHFVTWIESLYHTSVAASTVLVTTSPIWLAVLGFLLLRERPTRLQLVAIVPAVGGAILLGIGDEGAAVQGADSWYGNLLALGAAVFVSLYMLAGRAVRPRVSWSGYTLGVYTVVAVVTTGIALLQGTPLLGYSTRYYGLCLLMALGPQLLGHGSVIYALRYLPATVIGILTLFEPVGASLTAFLLWGERPGPTSLLGMVVVLGAIIVTVAGSVRERRAESGGGEVGKAPLTEEEVLHHD